MTVRIWFVWQYSMWVIEVSIKPPCAQIFGEHACHPERISRSPERSEGEGSSSPDTEILRGVYPERSEWAQDDSLFLMDVLYLSHRYSKGIFFIPPIGV